MKIPRPKPPETPFKRNRPPPPQATRLLVASLLAALVFMALLAIVFIPPYLENLNQPPSALLQLALNTSSGAPRIYVTSASVALVLSKFNATLLRYNSTLASLPPGLAGGNATLSFIDANLDGKLDVGDYFAIQAPRDGAYSFEIWQVDVGHLVGVERWTGAVV